MFMKRFLSAAITLAMVIQLLPLNAFAEDNDPISPDALRVSDEFVAKYPNGMLDIVTQNTITSEDAGEINIIIARRGGTDGEVDVSLKAIETTAKYGEDFVFVEDGFFGEKEVEKKVDTPTLMESSIADFGDEAVTVEGFDEQQEVTDVDGSETDADITETETADDPEKVTDVDGAETDAVITETETADDSEEVSADVPETSSGTEGFDPDKEYGSSLHRMRDSILNKSTEVNATSNTDMTELFSVDNDEEVNRDEAVNAVMPGAFVNLHFDDGENYKIVKIKIIDDDIVENEEAIMLGLFNCQGAELGNNITSNICIKDNDARTEDTQLCFEETGVNVSNENGTARLKIVRSNNIETYQLLNIQTLGGTAKADINYSSLVTEAVLLAGQEYKYIDIPIHKSDITEPVSFEVRVSGASCTDAEATVTIYPAADMENETVSLMSEGNVELMANDQPAETIFGKNYDSSSYADSGRLVIWDNKEGGVELNADKHRWGYLFYSVDLRGIEKVEVRGEGTWADTNYPNRVTHEIYIEGSSNKWVNHKNWGPANYTFGTKDFPHRQTRIVGHADSNWHNNTRLWIDYIKLYKQQITVTFDTPDTFKIPIYSGNTANSRIGWYTENGMEKVVSPQSSISVINKNSQRINKFYRDDTLTLSSTLSSEGQKYGAYLKGYELYNPSSRTYTYVEGTEIKLTPENIGTYVYGTDNTYASNLRVKPVYGRQGVDSKIKVGNYATHKGSMSFNNEQFQPNTEKSYAILTGYRDTTVYWQQDFYDSSCFDWLSVYQVEDLEAKGNYIWPLTNKTYSNPPWAVGDYVAVTLNPADGYSAVGINDINGNRISEGSSNTVYVQLKKDGNTFVPVFNRNDCGVTFMFEGDTNGLYVFHDKKDNADRGFLGEMYKNTAGISNWNNSVFTGILNKKIKSNYDSLRRENQLSGQKLSNLAIGDVVTVYGEAPDGYIPYWYIDDGYKTITTDDDKIYARHYGNSFSFEMTSNDITLYCGMVKKNAENYVMTGKLVKPSQTLKGKGYARVNPNIPDSYTPVPGAILSVINFDERNNSTEINGVKYYSSVTTDTEGNFNMYVPNVSEREYFAVRYTNGMQIKAKTLLAANGKTYYIAVPANDTDYTVKSIDCRTMLGDMAETNGLIKIPYSSQGANRSFVVNTVRSNENNIIGNAYLNSYRKDGSLITSVKMAESSSSGLEGIWRADVNIAEILADGGRITVELFDKRGVSRGEVETGYTLEKEPQPVNISVSGMPTEYATKGLSNVPVVGSKVPTVPGSSFVEQPDDKTLEIAVGQGQNLKNAIYSQLEAFNNSDNWSKLMYLTNYITDTYNVNVSKSKEETPNEDDELSNSSEFPILFDFGMYMKLDKNDDGSLALNYVFVTVGAKLTYSKTWQWVACGIPLYVTLSAGGTVRGLIGVNGTTDYFYEANVKDDAFYALLGKYGQDEIENKNYSDSDENNQKLFAALYNQSNLTEDKSQAADVLTDFAQNKKEQTASAIDSLLDRYDFYYINEDIFEAKSSGYTQDLQNRISMYRQLVEVTQRFEPNIPEDTSEEDSETDTEREPYKSNVVINYDAEKVTQSWIHRLNLLLLLESLPDYLCDGKTLYMSDDGIGPNSINAITGIVTLQPSFSVGVGAGLKGVLSLGISGHIDFVVNWQPWEDTRGTVSFGVNVDIDILVIPLSLQLIGYTVEMWRTDGYLDNAFDTAEGGSGVLASLMSVTKTDTNAGVNTAPKRRGGNNMLEPSDDISLFASYDEGFKYIDETMDYQTETTKHPQPNLFLLPNGNKLIIYMNDNLDRGLYDRNSIYYSVFDKSTKSWSGSIELDEDGTLDGDIETMQLDDGRVVLVWTDSSSVFGDNLPDMADLLTAQNINLCVFSEDGIPGEIKPITSLNEYGYSNPSLSCIDNTLNIVYKMTDYHTSGVEFDYDNIEGTYQSFMTNSYDTLAATQFDIENGVILESADPAYTQFEQSSGISLNGMEFIDSDIAGLENPKINDITQGVYKGKTFVVYSLDTDNNTSTDADVELFCMIKENGAYSKPIRLTDNTVKEGNAQIVVNDIMNNIYFGSGAKISTIDLYDISADKLEDKGSYYAFNKAAEQTDSVLEYKSEEAAESFKIFHGNNGIVYMLWSQFNTKTDDENKIHKNRSLYMKTYDPKFTSQQREDEENGIVTEYAGSWGLTSEILSEENFYINEPTIVVTENNKYTLAYRLFSTEELKKEDVTLEKEADTSILCVTDFELVSSISAEKTRQYPEYPREGEKVTIDFNCSNYGTIPSDMIQFNYYLVTDADIEYMDEANNTWWSMGTGEKFDGTNCAKGYSMATIKNAALFEGHTATRANLGDSVTFIMPPYEKEVDFYVLALEDDTTVPTISKIPVTVAPEIKADELSVAVSEDNEELSIKGIIRNVGNTSAENCIISIYADGSYDAGNIMFDNENTDFADDAVNLMIAQVKIDLLAPGETYDLDYTITDEEEPNQTTLQSTIVKKSKLPSRYFNSDGIINISASAEYDSPENNGEVSLQSTIVKKSKLLGSARAKKSSEDIPVLTNINIGIPSESETVSLMSAEQIVNVSVGETANLNISLEPYGSSKGYTLLYESADNSIAEINSSKGEITGVGKGETTVKIKAIRNEESNIVLLDYDNVFKLPDGNIWELENDTNTVANEVVMEKEVTVNVAEATPTPTPQKHSGGGNSSSNYNVSFSGGDGVSIDAVKVNKNGTITELPTPEKEGYTFEGWYTDEALTIPFTSDTKVNGDLKLYAKWTEKVDNGYVNPFKDVTTNDWFYDSVKYALQNSLFKGVSEELFAPQEPLTRAMLVTVLYRAEGEPDMTDEVLGYPFADVDSNTWYADAVYWARLNKIVYGYSDEYFGPDDNITREQIATIVQRYATFKGIEKEELDDVSLDYADINDISSWAVEAVKFCKENALMIGNDKNEFMALSNATRAEAAAITQRFIESLKSK